MSKPETKVIVMSAEQFIDVTAPQMVEISISADRTKLWVNVDGICRLRVYQIPDEGLHIYNDSM